MPANLKDHERPETLPQTDAYSGFPVTDSVDEMALDTMRVLADNPEDLDLALRVYADVKRAQKHMAEFLIEVEKHAVELMPAPEKLPNGRWKTQLSPVDGVGTFSVYRKSARTTWSDDTLAEYVERAHEAGMINGPKDIANVVREVAGISYYRVGALNELGIDADDHRERLMGDLALKWA